MTKSIVQTVKGNPVGWLQRQGTILLIGVALLFLPIIYFQYTEVSWYPLDPFDHLIQNGLAYLFLLLFTYVNHTVFVPRWYLTNQYSRYSIVVVICLLCVVWFSHRLEQLVFLKPPKHPTLMGWVRQVWWAENMFPPPLHERESSNIENLHFREKQPLHQGDKLTLQVNSSFTDSQTNHRKGRPIRWLKLAIIFLLGGISSLFSITLTTANRLRQVEQNQLEAELSQLKAQIRPHFLYNTLNSIYALAIRKDDRAADMVVKLAEFMRYMTRDAHRDSIPLKTETNYMANYIDLQKLRLQNTDCVQFELLGDVSRWQIAPLLLVTFVENAFKYGINPAEACQISVKLSVQDGTLHLMVSNQKVTIGRFEKSLGIGLKNTKDRLALLYPKKHTLQIEDTRTHFRVDLTLNLSA